MSHDIERLADGTAAFASSRVPAWHQLGTVTREAMTAAEAITNAKLGGWNVRKIPVAGHTITGSSTPTGGVEEWIDAPFTACPTCAAYHHGTSTAPCECDGSPWIVCPSCDRRCELHLPNP